MSTVKRLLRGLPNLGQAIDARLRRRGLTIEIRQSTGQALGAAPAGSGSGGQPVYPEKFVSSLKKNGAADALSGELELAASGELALTQNSAAPHFTIGTPVYTASNGVERAGNDFRADSSVVRTSGDQSIAGVKSFNAFPETPAAEPASDYDTANKKYVDDLGTANRQCFPMAGGLSGEVMLANVNVANYPSNILLPDDFKVYGLALFSSPPGSGAAALNDAYAVLEWTSTASGSQIASGARVAAGGVGRRWGAKAVLTARICVNVLSRLSGIFLELNDCAGHSWASSDLRSALSDGIWGEISSGQIDVTGWSGVLHLSLTIQGTDVAANTGYTNVYVEALYLELLPR